jgi:chromosome partitioning protein
MAWGGVIMIITIAHTKGGVGKSTLSWNLAHSIRAKGEKVTIIDLDFQQTLFFINSIASQNGNPTIEVIQPQSGSELIEVFEEAHGYIIVDVGGFDNDINRIAMSWADKIIVPVSNSVTEVIGFKTFEAILGDIDTSSVNIVLNNIHPLTKNFNDIHQAIATTEYTTLLKTVIRSRKTYKDTLTLGKSVFNYEDLKALKEIEGLRDELIS